MWLDEDSETEKEYQARIALERRVADETVKGIQAEFDKKIFDTNNPSPYSEASYKHMVRAVKLPDNTKKRKWRIVLSPMLCDLPKWITYEDLAGDYRFNIIHYERIWWRIYVKRKYRPRKAYSGVYSE